ncbi:hypothetical protein [Nocardia panacis]|nr:hypothetical protein [Nocardia panacis]
MAVHVVDRVWLTGDHTNHQARRVGDDRWVVSYLRGRAFSTEQAAAAIQAADAAQWLAELAERVGLTALEVLGLIALEHPWDSGPGRRRPNRRSGRNRS